MAKRISALHKVYQVGHFGQAETHTINLSLVANLCLQQVSAWPDTVNQVAEQLGINSLKYGEVAGDWNMATFYTDPVTWWLIGSSKAAITLDPQIGTVLDLSHSRTRVRISGSKAADLLSKLIPIDCRPTKFKQNQIVATAIHHVGVHVWHHERGYDLLIPRGLFSVSVWEILLATALQYGVNVSETID